MTRGLDPGYDAGAFDQNPSFGIFTRLVEDNGINFAVQCLPDNDYENLVVPVGLNAAAGSQILFTASVSNLPVGRKVCLEDKLTGQFNRLDEAGSSYSVLLSAASQGAGRFYIHTKTAGLADAVQSLLLPLNANLIADGLSTQVLTVLARDASGNYLVRGGSAVLITKASGIGSISSVTDIGNGTYTATVTSPTVSGYGTFVATLDGNPVKSGTESQTEVSITYTPGPADAGQSTLTPVSANLMADGTSTQVLTVQARDAFSNPLTSGGATVLITKASGSGTISNVTDNNDGTYTATVTAPSRIGSGTFIASLNGLPVKSGTDVQTVVTVNYTVVIKSSTGNGSWFNDGTWIPPGIPTELTLVRINGTHSVTVGQKGAVCFNLMIEPGGVLTITPGNSMTILGDLSNAGSLIIDSDALNSGSLITRGTASGNITYNRFITGGNQWHMVSSPVKGQSVRDFILAGENSILAEENKYGLGRFVENQHDWLWYTTWNIGSAGDFIPGQGYEAQRSGNGTITFRGTIEPSVSIGVTRSVGDDPGWNLIGNPYTSFLHANSGADESNNFLSANRQSLEPSHVGIYYWNSLTFDYEPVNHSSPEDWIAPGQGFFIDASASSLINFPAAIRTHESGSFKTSPAWPEIELNAATSYKNSKTVIRFNPGMTGGLDPGYDCGTFDKEPFFGIYSRLIEDNGVNFAIQCLPDDFENLTIPIGLKVPGASHLVFRANTCNLGPGIRVYLEDRLLNVFTRLDETGNSYTVFLEEGSEGTGRFFLVTNPANLEVPLERISQVSIILIPREQKIRLSGTVDWPARVTVTDISGRIISSERLAGAINNELYLKSIRNGLYIVSVKTPTATVTQKIAWVK